jgi:hypothetical protein
MKQFATKINITESEESVRISVEGIENDEQQEKLFKLILYGFLMVPLFMFAIYKLGGEIIGTNPTGKEIGQYLIIAIGGLILLSTHLLAIKVFIWQIAGQEIYEVTPDRIRITKSTFAIGMPRIIKKEEIISIELKKPQKISTRPISKWNPLYIPVTGLIRIKRKRKFPVIIGMGLHRGEAATIILAIKKKLNSTNT